MSESDVAAVTASFRAKLTDEIRREPKDRSCRGRSRVDRPSAAAGGGRAGGAIRRDPPPERAGASHSGHLSS